MTLTDVQAELEKRYNAGLSFAVAVDGSSMSERATGIAASFTNNKRGDKLQIIHISDQSKLSYLPAHLKPAHLRNYFQDHAAKYRVKAEWVCREKEEGQSTCQAVTKIADKSGVDVLFLGSFGRKGEKIDMLGTVSDWSLRESHASVCVVRSSAKFDTQATFLFATDGSHAAAIAFCILVTKFRRPKDIVNVVMVSTTDGVKEQAMVEQYTEFMQAYKVPGKAYVKCIDRSKTTVPEGILDAVTESGSDLLVMGISGYSNKKLGSVSEETILHTHCTTLVIKDRRDNSANRYHVGARSLASQLLPSKMPSQKAITAHEES